MASQLIVVDSQMKRAVVKVTPTKPLYDVLVEACSKLGHKPEQYGLKHNNKTVDLSRNVRLSGFTNNAKLELVQASRSPSVVSVALQLPAVAGGSSSRLTDKFPSNTSIWQILRRFEAGTAGSTSSANHNFTQRATPMMATSGASGSGRLCYEMPVVNVMNRDLSSFVDLQKTLGQLGFNGGTCLLRLSFKNTQQPLEEAMAEISRYFQEADEAKPTPETDARGAHAGSVAEMTSKPDVESAIERDGGAGGVSPPQEDTEMTPAPAPAPGADATTFTDPNSTSTPQTPSTTQPNPKPTDPPPPSQTIEIHTPSTSLTPAASQITHNETDYDLSVHQAQSYQSMLSKASRNKKLLSDEEIAEQDALRQESLKQITSIRVALRLPDTSRVTKSYDRNATTSDLYAQAREVLNRPKNEAFTILFPGRKDQGRKDQSIKEDGKKLISDLGWSGSVLVTVEWSNPGEHQGSVLKEEYLRQAKEMRVSDVNPVGEVDVSGDVPASASSSSQQQEGGKGKNKTVDKEERMKKLMSKMGFKK